MNHINIKGAYENNLKDIDISIPRNKIVAFVGVSGSGKSTLVFDIIAKEGQRQYFESLSSYARRYLTKSNRPNVKDIKGLSPAVIISQDRIQGNPRSTVGTITKAYTYLRMLYSRAGYPIYDSSYFSFNHPKGACSTCKGLGRSVKVNESKLLDMNKSLNEGAILLCLYLRTKRSISKSSPSNTECPRPIMLENLFIEISINPQFSHFDILIFCDKILAMTTCSNTNTSLYDQDLFSRGFALLENNSFEKEDIAELLYSFLNNRFGNKNIDILDLASGSGTIWRQLHDKHPKTNYSLTMVDNSSNQKEIAEKINDYKIICEDALRYIRSSKEKYDVITAIHFIASINKLDQQRFLEDCKSKLKSGGSLIIIRPTLDNPLSLAKTDIIKNALKKNRKKPRINIISDLSIINESDLSVQAEDMKYLAYFLAGKQMPNDVSDNLLDKCTRQLQKHGKLTNGIFTISLSSEVLIINR